MNLASAHLLWTLYSFNTRCVMRTNVGNSNQTPSWFYNLRSIACFSLSSVKWEWYNNCLIRFLLGSKKIKYKLYKILKMYSAYVKWSEIYYYRSFKEASSYLKLLKVTFMPSPQHQCLYINVKHLWRPSMPPEEKFVPMEHGKLLRIGELILKAVYSWQAETGRVSTEQWSTTYGEINRESNTIPALACFSPMHTIIDDLCNYNAYSSQQLT